MTEEKPAEKKPGRPPAKKEFVCKVKNIWTSEGKMLRKEKKMLPAKEVEFLEGRQNEMIERLIEG